MLKIQVISGISQSLLLDKVLMADVGFQAAVESFIFAFVSTSTLNFTQTPIKLYQ
jgi:hypothetical protein